MYLPQGGLAISVASTVWVGVCLVCFFNLRLGWSLAGLVIPGYLAPLLIIKPIVGIIDIIEGIFAYLLVKIVSKIGKKYGQWDNFFGRDLFFTIILSSVLIRLFFDGFILGKLADYFQIHYNYQIDYYANFNGYGLIIAALIAHQFWKEGFKRQIIPLLVVIIITYLFVRYGLMEFTNFRISQINSLYANIDEIFASSSKVYIILLITTLLATRMNIKYGWDYGGLLIAGLLALQWYSPLRISMTLLEAFIIYFTSNFLLSTKFFEQKNIVLARKILLFFNVGFIYKIILGDLVIRIFPEERVLEFYGFGYLLSTLIALKMHENTNSLRVIFMTLYTSFSGFVLGSIISLFLAVSTSFFNTSAEKINFRQESITSKEIEQKNGYLIGFIQNYKNNVQVIARLPFIQPTFDEIYELDQRIIAPLVHKILNFKGATSDLINDLHIINNYANHFGYKITLFNDLTSKQPFIIFSPNENLDKTKNWGIYIFRINSPTDQIIEVPRPFDEASTLDFSIFLFARIEAQFLLIGGTASDVNRDRSADLTRPQSKRSLYNLISQVLLRDHAYDRPIIQIRGYSLSLDNLVKTDSDVLIAFSDGAMRTEQLKEKQQELVKIIEREQLSYNIVSADEKTSGYEVGELFLARYMIQTPNKDLAVIWLSPWVRASFRNPESNFLSLSHYETLKIPSVKDSLKNLLKASSPISNWGPDDYLKILIEHYLDTGDITILSNIKNHSNYKFKHFILADDGREYLAIFNQQDNLLGLISLLINADNKNNLVIAINENSRLDLSLKRWIIFKD